MDWARASGARTRCNYGFVRACNQVHAKTFLAKLGTGAGGTEEATPSVAEKRNAAALYIILTQAFTCLQAQTRS